MQWRVLLRQEILMMINIDEDHQDDDDEAVALCMPRASPVPPNLLRVVDTSATPPSYVLSPSNLSSLSLSVTSDLALHRRYDNAI